MQVELVVAAHDMSISRADRDPKMPRDLGVRQAHGHQLADLRLPGGERREPRSHRITLAQKLRELAVWIGQTAMVPGRATGLGERIRYAGDRQDRDGGRGSF